jgi:hypothetical protein
MTFCCDVNLDYYPSIHMMSHSPVKSVDITGGFETCLDQPWSVKFWAWRVPTKA